MTSELRVTRLRTYPVKSFAGNDVDSATVEPWGLAGDRRWALVDDAGNKVTARKVHGLLGFRAEISQDSAIRITDPDGSTITVSTPRGVTPTPVKFRLLGHATPASRDVDEWLSVRIGRPVKLMWQEWPTERSIAAEDGGLPGDSLSFADASPLHLVTESSMRQLNDWIAADADVPDVPDIDPADLSDNDGVAGKSAVATGAHALDIVRFRPNVIVDGGEPFAEDRWSRIRIGGVEFRRTEFCGRCVMPTIEPTTLAGGKEPIRTLARHRRWDGETWFGIRLAPVGLESQNPPTIQVGDDVRVEVS